MRWERRIEEIRRSDSDHLVVNMMMRGQAPGVCDRREFHETAGMYHFHDLARPSLLDCSASETMSIHLPRAVALRLFERLDDLHGAVVGGGHADLLLAQSARR